MPVDPALRELLVAFEDGDAFASAVAGSGPAADAEDAEVAGVPVALRRYRGWCMASPG